MAKRNNEEREDDRNREAALLTDILSTRTADEWERFFQARHVPAARVRTLAEAVGDALPTILSRLGHVAEGVHSAPEVLRLAQKTGIEMPSGLSITGA